MSVNSEQIRSFLSDRLGLDTDEIEDDTLLFSSAILDSFSMVDLLMFLETSTQIRFNPTDVTLQNLDSIGRMLKFVESAHDD